MKQIIRYTSSSCRSLMVSPQAFDKRRSKDNFLDQKLCLYRILRHLRSCKGRWSLGFENRSRVSLIYKMYPLRRNSCFQGNHNSQLIRSIDNNCTLWRRIWCRGGGGAAPGTSMKASRIKKGDKLKMLYRGRPWNFIPEVLIRDLCCCLGENWEGGG